MKKENIKPRLIKVDENNVVQPNKLNARVCSLKKLKQIVTQAIINDYNRVIKFDEYFKTIKKKMIKSSDFGQWNGRQTKVIVEPFMVHQHANLEQVDDHMRCLISTGNTVAPDVWQDIPMEMFNTLDLLLPYYEMAMADKNKLPRTN